METGDEDFRKFRRCLDHMTSDEALSELDNLHKRLYEALSVVEVINRQIELLGRAGYKRTIQEVFGRLREQVDLFPILKGE